jgi:uncharacterized membrane protein YozB (DUF420 family)
MKGFLGTYASFSADLNLVLQLAMALALGAGAWLARKKRYRAHAICQSAVLLLNLPLIALVMWPSFDERVWPRIPQRIGKMHYAGATLHGFTGAMAELLGLYIVLVAGTNVVPAGLRIARWKVWMRLELALWWFVVAIGLVTYFCWYVPKVRI